MEGMLDAYAADENLHDKFTHMARGCFPFLVQYVRETLPEG